MSVEITIPSLGESITEVTLGRWLVEPGAWVEKDDPLVELESDKVTQELPAPASGIIAITHDTGTDQPIGAIIGQIDTDAARPAQTRATSPEIPATRVEVATETTAASTPEPEPTADAPIPKATPMARHLAAERGVDLAQVHGTGPAGRVRKSDVPATSLTPTASTTPPPADVRTDITGMRGVRRERMSRLRQRIAERLVQAQQSAAMLTTFNEADMTQVLSLRAQHKDDFHDRFGVKLGFMSFFAKAVVSALEQFPALNAWIDGTEIEYHDYVDLSVAVGTDRGLVVPVVRNADRRSFAEIESEIGALAARAREGSLGLEDMQGGTFTISNGGVYGSMMSTPILNPPQSGILGLHRIQKRAIEDPDNPGQIALRPMMYLAVSYDHRIVDGAEAVGFLVHIKQCIESPQRLLLGM